MSEAPQLSEAALAFMAAFHDQDDGAMLQTVKALADEDVGTLPRFLQRHITGWRSKLRAEGKLDV